ncbi:MAG: prepilin-type N-terminal cleavage/methylation domain-containing protein [Candidatus Omnitrophica bacterium]|nr:prepilin-type N-terminal cleavage/methylation domain-containing protein [Candidatus Omnitrophota bacterium]
MKKLLQSKMIRRNKRGFTLIEFMIVATITIVFLLAAVLVMIVGYRNWHINRAVITLHDDLVNSLRSMVREIREAGAASPNGIVVLGPDNNGIRFELPTAVSETGPTAWQTIVYSLGGTTGKEILRNDGAAVRILATNISDVDFTYNALNPREVGIDVTGTKEAANGSLLTQSLSMEVTIRN